MDKQVLKKELFRMQELLVNEFEEKVVTTHSMVDIDEGDIREPEDASHQYESGEIEQLFKVQLNRAKGKLEELKNLDFGPKSMVECGAVVQTDKRNFIVGFPMLPFDFEGKEYLGLSREAPIYSAMQGKKSGEKFSFCGINYTITSIY